MMSFIRKSIFLQLTFLPFLLHSGGCLRSVIVADTFDNHIGYSCISDAYRLKKSLQAISSQLHMRAEITVLDKLKCQTVDLKRWLRSQKPSATDVVIILYTGHGVADPSGNQLPLLDMVTDKFRGTDLQEAIEQFRCRLSILFLDCCNKSDEKSRSTTHVFHPVIHRNRRLAGLKHLFRGTKAAITVCAASVGEYAKSTNVMNPVPGGYLTTGFLYAMKELAVDPKVTWEAIFYKASEFATKLSNDEQHPFFIIKPR